MRKALTILLLLTAALTGLSSCIGHYIDPGVLGLRDGTSADGIVVGGGGSATTTKTYTGTDGESTYTLEVTGDRYVLTVTDENGVTKTSTGTVTGDNGNGTLTLTPDEDPDNPFTITVNDDGITNIDGEITYDDGTKEPAPGNITPKSAGGINIDVEMIVDIDVQVPIGPITISRSGSGNPVTYTVTVTNALEYSSISWNITGVGSAGDITGAGASFILDAADTRYNSLGVHALTLTVSKDGQQYQRVIPFTVVQ